MIVEDSIEPRIDEVGSSNGLREVSQAQGRIVVRQELINKGVAGSEAIFNVETIIGK
jgi:hypothetical protein